MSTDQLSILLVDDYEMIRVVVRRALNDLGYPRVSDAAGGREALTMIEAAVATGTPYDLVFCDWAMPEVDGLAVLTQIRANPATRNLPFIMLTAEADKRSIVAAMKAGANDYIIKPVSAKTIGEKLERQFAKPKPNVA